MGEETSGEAGGGMNCDDERSTTTCCGFKILAQSKWANTSTSERCGSRGSARGHILRVRGRDKGRESSCCHRPAAVLRRFSFPFLLICVTLSSFLIGQARPGWACAARVERTPVAKV